MAGIVHEVENHRLVEQAVRELAEIAHLRRGQIVVIGCSTSEVVGHQVGSWSTPEVADAIFRGLSSVFSPMGVYLAAQCCEHLNRALIVEHEAVPRSSTSCLSPRRAARLRRPRTKRSAIPWRSKRYTPTPDLTSAAR